MAEFDPDVFTKPFQLTKSMHRDVYPAIDPKNPQLSAAGQCVLITGAGGTIGRHVALAWATAGAAAIVLVGRVQRSLEETATKLRAQNAETKVLIKPLDITARSEVETLFGSLKQDVPELHVLVNVAGALNDAPSLEANLEDWWRDFEVNVKGSYQVIHCFVAAYKPVRKTIINISTPAIAFNSPGFSSYATSKLAITRLGEFLQLEHPDLRVFTVSPGNVPSQLTKPEFLPYAKDSGGLMGGFSLYLNYDRADYLKGGYLRDVEEMERHQKEIVEKNLLKTAFLYAKLGPGGHPWEQDV
ncbi:MAG: hypothetical protein MMC23_005513 [Stictis urceolatum]|nr:hypothetical protein [Stictis urceolata]